MIDPLIILILSISFNCLTVSTKLLAIANKKGYFKKLNNYVHRNRKKIEASLKSNESIIITDEDVNDEVNSFIEDVHNNKILDNVIDLTSNIIDLVSIAKMN